MVVGLLGMMNAKMIPRPTAETLAQLFQVRVDDSLMIPSTINNHLHPSIP
jgi:hypothetical protein